MITNYVKFWLKTDPGVGEFYFFDDRDPAQVIKARMFADLRSGKLDIFQKPPALTQVSVYRPVLEWPDVLEIGEYRERAGAQSH